MQRAIDSIPATIRQYFMQRFADGLQEHLFAELNAGAEDAPRRFEAWMREDPAIARERKRLQDLLQRLSDIKGRLDSYLH